MTRNHDQLRYDRAKNLCQALFESERADREEKTTRLRQARLAREAREALAPEPARELVRAMPKRTPKRPRRVIEVD
jgi:hypothetical protein